MASPAPAEYARMRRLVDRARTGNGGVLVVRDEAGATKSGLPAEAASAAAAGMTVLEARAVASETGP